MTSLHTITLAACCLILLHGSLVSGHGRLIEPASRSSLWRFNYPGAVVNYNDHELNCGGFNNQVVHGGKCGVCGDREQGPRLNEAGGLYAKGIIARTYTEGDVIDVAVDMTSNHKGWFEFRACPNNDFKTPVTHDCLDKYLLPLADGSGTRYYISYKNEVMQLQLKLPEGLVCTQCVVQWKYHAGNNWGVNPDGKGCVGCGAQEEFYGCADVVINPKNAGGNTESVPAVTEAGNVAARTVVPVTATDSDSADETTDESVTRPSTKSTPVTTTTTTTATTAAAAATTAKSSAPSVITTAAPEPQPVPGCRPVGIWKTVTGMTGWCKNNCAAGFCPGSHCKCGASRTPASVCRPVGVWTRTPGMQFWCKANCAAGYCPATHCICN